MGRSKKEKVESTETILDLPFKKKNWKNTNCQTRGNQRLWPHLKQIIAQENYSRLPVNTPTWTSIEASSSVLPPKKYCDVTGFQAPYCDPKTKMRFCSSEIYQFIHKQLTEEEREKYLLLRRVQTKIK